MSPSLSHSLSRPPALPPARPPSLLPTSLWLPNARSQQLRELSVFDNSISGVLPTSLTSLGSLQRIIATTNQISGEVGRLLDPVLTAGRLDAGSGSWTPGTATRWPDVEHLYLSENRLSGTLPKTFGALSKLRTLHLSRNEGLGGALPDAFVAGSALEELQLSYTRLSGSIPSELGSLTALQNVLIEQTRLSGTIPSQLGRCADLTNLILEFNRLSGTIPLDLGGNCTQAFDYAIKPREPDVVDNTDLLLPRSDPTDGPRGVQNPLAPPHRRNTAANLRFRGNPAIKPNGPNSFGVDLIDLTSHDLCAYAQGPIDVVVGATGAHPFADTMSGSVFRKPSRRAAESIEDILNGDFRD